MRVTALAMAAGLALAACGPGVPGGAGSSAPSAGGVFPNLFQASYRAEATMRNPETGELTPVVTMRDGAKMRMEVSVAGNQSVIISNAETRESIIISEAQGRMIAMRQTLDASDFKGPEGVWGETAEGVTLAGPCVHLGESGSEWRTTDASGENASCVTGDGIILWASSDGARVWETTSIARGPQPASLFEVPPGVEVMDLGNMADMIERARANAGQ